MRAIDKGTSTTIYSKYGDARHDLAERIGYYCSYCEMGTNNMIEVEHVHPVANGGNELDWDNFLLSCKYCNTVKSNDNQDRTGYFWPDVDNTDLVYDYTLSNQVVTPKPSLLANHITQAQALIDLVGLNRYPGSGNEPTEADTRWRLRDEAKITAMSSYNRWFKMRNDLTNPFVIDMAEQIAETSLIGFFSIWCKIFENEPFVLEKIDAEWKRRYNNYKEYQPGTTTRIVRPNGQI